MAVLRTSAVIVAALVTVLAGVWIYARDGGAAPTTRLAAQESTPTTSPVTSERATTATASHSATSTHPAPSRSAPAGRCASNHSARLVLVSISAQHAWLCGGTHTVYQTAVTTGMSRPGDTTPTGRFHVQGRDRNAVLRPDDGGAYPVKYWIPFDAPDYGFHDSSWQTIPYGSPAYRSGGSHGCVHMPLKAIEFLYGWVRVGTPVVIER